MPEEASRAQWRKRTRVTPLTAALLFGWIGASAAAGAPPPAGAAPGAGIHDPPASGMRLRHAIPAAQLQALVGLRFRDARAEQLLRPDLKRLLGGRYDDFRSSLVEEQPLRIEGKALVGEGVVPGTLGYRGAFFAFGENGEVFAVVKSGRHGTTIERFGSLDLLKSHPVLHAYQEFVGIDE